MQPYVFIVGKADPFAASVGAIRRAGFSVGLLLDRQVAQKDTTDFDLVIAVDFTSVSTLQIPELLELPVAGLICTYESYIPAKARLAQMLGLPGPDPESARFCTDKLLMRQAFAAYDPRLSPAFAHIASVEEAAKFAGTYGFPVIIKPANLVKSLLVIRCDTMEQLRASTAYAFSHIAALYERYRVYGQHPKLIIEQFLEGQLYSVAAFADAAGEAILCPGITALKTAGQAGFDDNFLYSRTLPAQLDDRLEQRLVATARQGMAALKLRSSPAHVELIHTVSDEIKIIEIGARIGGYRPRMYRLSYGIDLPAMEIAVATGEPLAATPPAVTGYTAVYELFPDKVGRFDTLVSKQQLDRVAEQAYSLDIKLKAGDSCGPAKDGYKAAATIIVYDGNHPAFVAKCTEVERLGVTVL